MSASETVIFEGLDEAIVGFARRCGRAPVAVYSEERVLALLEGQGMDAEEAREFYEFNIVGAYVGEDTPVFLMKLEDADAE